MSQKKRSQTKLARASASEKLYRGQPGYRNRGNRTGLDPVDTYSEMGRAEGLFIRAVLRGKLRTRNPFLLLLLAVLGGLMILPLLAAISEYINTNYINPGLFCFFPMGLLGILLLVNVFRNVNRLLLS